MIWTRKRSQLYVPRSRCEACNSDPLYRIGEAEILKKLIPTTDGTDCEVNLPFYQCPDHPVSCAIWKNLPILVRLICWTRLQLLKYLTTSMLSSYTYHNTVPRCSYTTNRIVSKCTHPDHRSYTADSDIERSLRWFGASWTTEAGRTLPPSMSFPSDPAFYQETNQHLP